VPPVTGLPLLLRDEFVEMKSEFAVELVSTASSAGAIAVADARPGTAGGRAR
jgi:hypothetical protein